MALLIVEREVSDVDLAGTAQFSWWRPEDIAVAGDHRQGAHVGRCVVLDADKKNIVTSCDWLTTIIRVLFWW